MVVARDLWVADRNFCTTGFLFGIAGRGGSFVIRQHASTLHWEFVGKRRACGRVDTGKVFEQTIRATDEARRDPDPAADHRAAGSAGRRRPRNHILTNVPAKDAGPR